MRITHFSPQLQRMIDFASQRIGKSFIVKTNPALIKSPGSELSVSLPDRMELHRVIPIYISNIGSVSAQAQSGLPIETEFAVADQIAAHLAHESGYRRLSDVVFGVNDPDLKKMGEDVLGHVKSVIQEVPEQVSDLTSALVTHNITSGYGFDPTTYMYENRLYEDLHVRPDMFSIAEMQKAKNVSLDPLLYPNITKVLMFEALLELARLHIFFPTHLREELFRDLDPFMMDLLISFLTDTGLDDESHYYLGDEFMDKYTCRAHARTQQTVLDYLVRDDGNLNYQMMPKGGLDQTRQTMAMKASESYDHFSAYSILSMIEQKDVSWDLARVKGAMRRKITDSHPSYSEIQVQRKIVEVLMERKMLRAAIIYQEEQFGAEADLDYDYI